MAVAKPTQLKADPPVIFSSPDPAVLLVVDGKPVLAPIEGTDLQFVVNTTWDVFFSPSDAKYYLVTERGWLTRRLPRREVDAGGDAAGWIQETARG